jgi:hypothetical protein
MPERLPCIQSKAGRSGGALFGLRASSRCDWCSRPLSATSRCFGTHRSRSPFVLVRAWSGARRRDRPVSASGRHRRCRPGGSIVIDRSVGPAYTDWVRAGHVYVGEGAAEFGDRVGAQSLVRRGAIKRLVVVGHLKLPVALSNRSEQTPAHLRPGGQPWNPTCDQRNPDPAAPPGAPRQPGRVSAEREHRVPVRRGNDPLPVPPVQPRCDQCTGSPDPRVRAHRRVGGENKNRYSDHGRCHAGAATTPSSTDPHANDSQSIHHRQRISAKHGTGPSRLVLRGGPLARPG